MRSSSMTPLSADLNARLRALTATANELALAGTYELAADKFAEALALLPSPRHRCVLAGRLLVSLGDVLFHIGRFAEALEWMEEAMACDMADNAFVRLRAGQAQLELGQREAAADNLARAYAGGGVEIFAGESDHYFEFLKAELRALGARWIA